MAGSTDTARCSPVALAINPMTMATSGKRDEGFAGNDDLHREQRPEQHGKARADECGEQRHDDRLHRESGPDARGGNANRLEHREVS